MLNAETVREMPKLGFGLMRLPMLDGEIDLEQTKQMVDLFLENGFRYFDTAYGYNNGASEIAIGRALVERYPRDRFLLATKLPAWAGAKNADEAKHMLDVSLERTGAGYFDFYLLHNLGGGRTKCFEDFGIWEYLAKKREEGVIRNLGFSFHDKAELLDRILDEHPEVDFVQLQINYLDWESPDVQSRKCYEAARRHAKPVVIMEPVKGGNLANPPKEITDRFEKVAPGVSPASMAIRFAASLEGVLTVLSGMSSLDQMKDNLKNMKPFVPLNGQEQEAMFFARQVFESIPVIPCTSCGYCMKDCPMQVGIPASFAAYNSYLRFGNKEGALGMYNWQIRQQKRSGADECIGCGACEQVCPQHIPIREELRKIAEFFTK